MNCVPPVQTYMEQTLFSSLIFDFLQKEYPDFFPVKYLEDNSFDCSIQSPSGEFSMWIATYGCEITYGIEAPDGKTDIHSHFSCYEIDDIPDCLQSIRKWIQSVINNEIFIYCKDSNAWDWIDHETLKKKELKAGKVYPKHYWVENSL